MSLTRIQGIILACVLAACSGKASPEADARVDSTHGATQLTAAPMLPAFRAELDSMAAHPSMMHDAMPRYQAKVKQVVDAMHADMRAAGMPSDPAYEALADSVVKGSVALSTAAGPEFERLLAEHLDQTRRLTAVYESKTSPM
jgi:hypothetical protein